MDNPILILLAYIFLGLITISSIWSAYHMIIPSVTISRYLPKIWGELLAIKLKTEGSDLRLDLDDLRFKIKELQERIDEEVNKNG